MTCYHFTMKIDRKPDKTPVSAETHFDYINRDGKFKNIDFERAIKEQEFTGNMLCPTDHRNSESLKTLYRSVYGSLIDNGVGIESSDKSSVETLQIALVLAMKKYGTTLDVSGSTEYKARILVAASEIDLPISFSDNAMNQQYGKIQEEQEHERKRIRKSCAERATRSGIHIPDIKQIGQKRPPSMRKRMHVLSERSVDENAQGIGMLLPGNNANSMGQHNTDQHCIMRRNVSRRLREATERTAMQILCQNNDTVLAASHADYINRKENFAAKGGCIFTDNHLPNWANDSAKAFFKAADIYERSNGVRYREIEFALPNELNLGQQKEIIQTFIDHHLKDHYYAYAVHV